MSNKISISKNEDLIKSLFKIDINLNQKLKYRKKLKRPKIKKTRKILKNKTKKTKNHYTESKENIDHHKKESKPSFHNYRESEDLIDYRKTVKTVEKDIDKLYRTVEKDIDKLYRNYEKSNNFTPYLINHSPSYQPNTHEHHNHDHSPSYQNIKSITEIFDIISNVIENGMTKEIHESVTSLANYIDKMNGGEGSYTCSHCALNYIINNFQTIGDRLQQDKNIFAALYNLKSMI